MVQDIIRGVAKHNTTTNLADNENFEQANHLINKNTNAVTQNQQMLSQLIKQTNNM